jgi:hypothetical protein
MRRAYRSGRRRRWGGQGPRAPADLCCQPGPQSARSGLRGALRVPGAGCDRVRLVMGGYDASLVTGLGCRDGRGGDACDRHFGCWRVPAAVAGLPPSGGWCPAAPGAIGAEPPRRAGARVIHRCPPRCFDRCPRTRICGQVVARGDVGAGRSSRAAVRDVTSKVIAVPAPRGTPLAGLTTRTAHLTRGTGPFRVVPQPLAPDCDGSDVVGIPNRAARDPGGVGV